MSGWRDFVLRECFALSGKKRQEFAEPMFGFPRELKGEG
jgi:hypothetical protein